MWADRRSLSFQPFGHWASDKSHQPFPYGDWVCLYPTAVAIASEVGPRTLTVSYPNTTGTDRFTYMTSGIPPQWSLDGNTVNGFTNLSCLCVNVTAVGLEILPINYWGNVLHKHCYYNVTYLVPGTFTGNPKTSFEIKCTC